MAEKNYADAMLDVLRTTMDEDPTFVVMGNEVLGIGPEDHQLEPFKDAYPDRVYFPPCSEAAFAALAAGAAMCGQKVFAHLGLAPFTYPAFSSIANEIATAHMSSGGRIKVPAILHMSHGLLHGGGGQHSETPHGIYWNMPGIEIVVPSGAKEVKGLLRTAIKSENPTMVWTHAFGYGAVERRPDDDYEIPFGEADVKRQGGDVTIVACSTMVGWRWRPPGGSPREGIEAEVIDLRTLVPLDEPTRSSSRSARPGGWWSSTRVGAGPASPPKSPRPSPSRASTPSRRRSPGSPGSTPGGCEPVQEAYISPSPEKIADAAKRVAGEVASPAG